jgi:hypothetical protein
VAGKKGRSGPPGNLNSVKKPWEVFFRRRALRPEDRWIAPIVSRYGTDLIADQGGADDISTARRGLVEIIQLNRGAAMLVLAEAARSGFIVETDDGWDLAPGAKELGKFLGNELRALVALGLERRQRDALDLKTYLANRTPAAPQRRAADGQGVDTGAPCTASPAAPDGEGGAVT